MYSPQRFYLWVFYMSRSGGILVLLGTLALFGQRHGNGVFVLILLLGGTALCSG